MKELCKQCTAIAGAGFAGACCLGVTAALSVLTAIGAGFLIHDAFLVPLYLGLLALSVWFLYRSARTHGRAAAFRAGLTGAIVAFAGLWIHPALVYAGLAALISGSLWDFRSARRGSMPSR
jgi:hypothetical protein